MSSLVESARVVEQWIEGGCSSWGVPVRQIGKLAAAANEIERLEMENVALRHYAECCDEEIKAWREGRGAEYIAAMETLEEELEALSIHEGKPDA